MKNLYAVLALVFCSFISNAQIVNIPDENFKNYVLNVLCIDSNNDGILDTDGDTNNDGQISASEALLFTSLDLYNILNTSGIHAFTNVTVLKIWGQFTTLDVSLLTNLVDLDIYTIYDNLTALNINNLTNLESLRLNGSNITTFNFPSLPNLKKLFYSCGSLSTSLDVSNLVNLKEFSCGGGQFHNLDVSNLTNLEYLSLYWSGPESFNFPTLPNLKKLFYHSSSTATLNVNNLVNLTEFSCWDNNLQTLDVSNLSNLTSLNFSENNLTTIDLSNNINLTDIVCYNNNLNALDITNLNQLKYLDCSRNDLNTLEISNLNQLKYLDCNSNNISSFNVNNLSNLTSLNCAINEMNSLNLSGLINLETLDCGANNLTTLDISDLINLNSLSVYSNQLTALDFTNTTKLNIVNAGYNLFTSLDFSHVDPLYTQHPINQNYIDVTFAYNLSYNPNLTYLNIKNGVPLGIISHNDFWYAFTAYNCPNLTYICADEFNFQYIQVPNAQINTYCSFNPGGNYNTITGTFSLDNDNNGCDDNDYHFSDIKIKLSNSLLTGATFTNSSGKYTFFTQEGNFEITPVFENFNYFENPYFTISPTSATITFADSNNNTQTQNFCVTPNGVHNDVEVSVLPVQRPRPGFDATYQLVYKNKGNQVLSGNVNLAFNDAVLDFVTANPALAAQSLNTLSWSYANLLPFESRTINFTLNVNSPQEIPAVNIEDILNFSASIDPISGDETVNDNTFALTQTVLGSYDPNDKTCLEGNTIVPERIGEYLHYLIRFQNSGTAAAENIVVKDIIDTTKFDVTSLQLTSASHDYTTKITGNKVEFIFENINLPAEIDNEAASHGFVAFKIKTKNNLTVGNSVSNKADIYFDYNFPITTNEATTTFATLGVNQIENKSVAVFPNPVNDVLTITSKGNLTSIQLLDVEGRLIATYLESEEKATINLSDKASGVYFVKIFTEKGVKLEKIVKK